MLSIEVGVLLVSKVVESADKQNRIELLGKENRDRMTPIVAFSYGFTTQEHAGTLPALI